MSEETRQMVRELDPNNKLERGLPCGVRHPDAGGRCQRTATLRMYGVLVFCKEHGEEARIGALLEVNQEAGHFFYEHLYTPHGPDMNPIVRRELQTAHVRVQREGPGSEDHYRALRLAYPNTPEDVRDMVRRWARDERASGGPPPFDLLLDSYYTICKLMRLAHEDGEDWLVELLEPERQETAARAVFADTLSSEPRPVPRTEKGGSDV